MPLGQEDNLWVWVGIYPKQHGNSTCRKKETQFEINVCKNARFIGAKSMFLQIILKACSEGTAQAAAMQASHAGWPTHFNLALVGTSEGCGG